MDASISGLLVPVNRRLRTDGPPSWTGGKISAAGGRAAGHPIQSSLNPRTTSVPRMPVQLEHLSPVRPIRTSARSRSRSKYLALAREKLDGLTVGVY
jgi:hypothetical protein